MTEHIKNINQEHDQALRIGDRVADTVTATIGSWRFILIQSAILAAWITLNSVAWSLRWDNYPYVLLNLALSFQAAFSAPFVMMSQNRQASKDRLTAESDYIIDKKSAENLLRIMEHLCSQDDELLKQTTLLLQIIEKHMREEELR
jgi:uncharacterized membrane protein